MSKQKRKSATTIHDIARALNTTASTVSRALQDHPRISNATKKAVRDMAIRMNYQPNIMASGLRKGKSNTIGVIVPHINRHFFSGVISGIEEVLNASGYNIIICQSKESYDRECANIRILLNSRVDGIIASMSKATKDTSHFEMVQEMGVPLIFFDRAPENIEVSKILLDDYSGAFRAVEHLINMECKRIIHYAGPQNINIYRNRKNGYIEALKRHGITEDPALIYHDVLTKERGYNQTTALIRQKLLPDAFFCASDFSALGTILSLKEHGIEIPGEVAVIGFANELFTSLLEPSLTSIDQHAQQMGQLAARIFLEETTEHTGEMDKKVKIINPDLIIRQSSKKMD